MHFALGLNLERFIIKFPAEDINYDFSSSVSAKLALRMNLCLHLRCGLDTSSLSNCMQSTSDAITSRLIKFIAIESLFLIVSLFTSNVIYSIN